MKRVIMSALCATFLMVGVAACGGTEPSTTPTDQPILIHTLRTDFGVGPLAVLRCMGAESTQQLFESTGVEIQVDIFSFELLATQTIRETARLDGFGITIDIVNALSLLDVPIDTPTLPPSKRSFSSRALNNQVTLEWKDKLLGSDARGAGCIDLNFTKSQISNIDQLVMAVVKAPTYERAFEELETAWSNCMSQSDYFTAQFDDEGELFAVQQIKSSLSGMDIEKAFIISGDSWHIGVSDNMSISHEMIEHMLSIEIPIALASSKCRQQEIVRPLFGLINLHNETVQLVDSEVISALNSELNYG